MNEELNSQLIDFINDPYDINNNLALGYTYENINQYGSAISHYMRGAEYGLDSSDPDKHQLISICLLRAAEVFNKLGSRIHSTKSLVLHAISNTPSNPEAYLLLSKIHEQLGEWQECNTACCIGLSLVNDNYYPHQYESRNRQCLIDELTYNKAISNYYIGRVDKTRLELSILSKNNRIPQWMRTAVDNSINTIHPAKKYNQLNYDGLLNLKNFYNKRNDQFNSFSQCGQDIFVSSIIKKPGTYLEIGSGDPFLNNNTYLLERDFKWKGLSIDTDVDTYESFLSTRKNPVICSDARYCNYNDILKKYNLSNNIDYLQIDCEPPEVSYETLQAIPFDQYKFTLITFEHDGYRNSKVRKLSRKLLTGYGYKLLISNVSFNGKDSFEDWWYHPSTIHKHISFNELNEIKMLNDAPKTPIDIFVNC